MNGDATTQGDADSVGSAWGEFIVSRFPSEPPPDFAASRSLSLPTLPAGGEAILVWMVEHWFRRPTIWIADGPKTMEAGHRNLRTLGPCGIPLLYYPARGPCPGETDADIAGDRLATLAHLGGVGRGVIATCVQALMQLTVPPRELAAWTRRLKPGDPLDLQEFAPFLQQAGYEIVPEVESKGQAAVRGGIVDVWPPRQPWPARIELFGAEIESIRTFDPVEQRSTGPCDTLEISPADECSLLRQEKFSLVPLTAYLPPGTIFIWSAESSVREHAALYQATVAEAGGREFSITLDTLEAEIRRIHDARHVWLKPRPESPYPTAETDFAPLDRAPFSAPSLLQPDLAEQRRRQFILELVERAERGQDVFIFFDTPGALERFRANLPESQGAKQLHLEVGHVAEGFTSEKLRLAVVGESDVYGVRKLAVGRYRAHGKAAPETAGLRLADWTDIEPGELVVHLEHGVGKYMGLRDIEVNGQRQEALAIEYADKARLYVPVSQAHLLTRYVGIGKRYRNLDRLGGRQWSRDMASAQRAVQDLAARLLETQAARNALDGHAFAADTPWQHQFERAFPYQETEDQERAIADVKADMESRRPMDRLICGDAGYGKTEVAMRAAFKAVMEGRQVAVLVPTTVLAQQHFYTFRERMAAYPIRVEMLSRFCSRGEHAAVIAGLSEGTVDIVIGTHSLLQPGIRFRDLGLVIIDEEQRFGVLHKEQFKHMRRLVDVLTLTATPIPRTLYLSLTGARDLSTIQTPPQDRQSIETLIRPNTDEVIREAILRELNREGQVFYLHNRVKTIDRVYARVSQLVPEARIAVAHGQMASSELSEVMQSFARGDFEILLCTTIIESGLDIPNANTILIDRADRFGLAELYQLRGRVGRSRKRAYAYLLLPAHAHVDPVARRRIQAIQQYRDHGAGFRLAMRDLEIRGAGNLLGLEQSGHIAAVGFALYCQLLRRTVAQLRNEPVPRIVDVALKLDFIALSPAAASPEAAAVIPLDYIEDERLRIRAYRRIAEASSPEELATLTAEFGDRFGAPPPPLRRLLKIAEIRILAAEQGITAIEVQDDKVMMSTPAGFLMTGTRFPRLTRESPDARLDELLNLVHQSDDIRRQIRTRYFR